MFKRILSPPPYSVDLALVFLRMFTLFLVYYGYDKLLHFEDKAGYWPDPFGIGPASALRLTVFAELVCSLFVFLGLFTRIALIPAIINMLFVVLITIRGA